MIHHCLSEYVGLIGRRDEVKIQLYQKIFNWFTWELQKALKIIKYFKNSIALNSCNSLKALKLKPKIKLCRAFDHDLGHLPFDLQANMQVL